MATKKVVKKTFVPVSSAMKPEKPEKVVDQAEQKREKELAAREALAVELRASNLTVDEKRARVREFLAGG